MGFEHAAAYLKRILGRFLSYRKCSGWSRGLALLRKPILLTKDAKPPPLASLVISVSVDECGIANVAQSLQGIWNKAESLVLSDGHVIKAPWVSDEKARLVKSYLLHSLTL